MDVSCMFTRKPTTIASTADPSGAKTPRQQCTDTEEQCHWWMSIGGCTIWPDMDKRCPLSCKACTPSICIRVSTYYRSEKTWLCSQFITCKRQKT
uniref:ShKT domain-containing protein n=1 Tax=Romanomermis culicivorax TaxID=13658 RepID=A0A915LBG6_ROMCU